MTALIHNGKGAIPGVPARDLTADEVEQFGGEKKLLKTGVYVKPLPKVKQTSKQKDGE